MSVKSIEDASKRISSLSWSSQLLAAGSWDGKVRLYDSSKDSETRLGRLEVVIVLCVYCAYHIFFSGKTKPVWESVSSTFKCAQEEQDHSVVQGEQGQGLHLLQ